LIASRYLNLRLNTPHFNGLKTLDPGVRWDDFSKTVGQKIVIPAQAGIKCRLLFELPASTLVLA
jgi:hypothetical protein